MEFMLGNGWQQEINGNGAEREHHTQEGEKGIWIISYIQPEKSIAIWGNYSYKR